jgi:dipeptidyl aminopeptidase/acylaminoacyl peptidase
MTTVRRDRLTPGRRAFNRLAPGRLALLLLLASAISGLPGLVGAADAQELKPLSLDDYPRWSTVGQVALSNSGRWTTFSYAPNEGDSRLFLRDLDDAAADAVELSVNATGPVFSKDSRWLAFIATPPTGGRGGGAQGQQGAPPGQQPAAQGQQARTETQGQQARTRALHLLDLSGRRLRDMDLTGDRRRTVENVATFTFSEDSRWLAVHKARAGGTAAGAAAARGAGAPGGPGGQAAPAAAAAVDDAVRGADLILMDLASGSVTNLGNVAELAFNEAGTHLAFVVDAEGRAGNGVSVVELATMRVQPLSTGDYIYQGLAWSEDGTALAVLRGTKPQGKVQRENHLLTFAGAAPGRGTGAAVGAAPAQGAAAAPRPALAIYDPAADPHFPEGFVLSEFRPPSWSKDGGRVFVGIKAQEDEVGRSNEPRANVDVWHWLDRRVQSVQQVQAARDRRATHLGALNLEGPRFVRLATDDMEQVQLTDDGRWALGFDDSRYWMDRDQEANRRDVYRIDPGTGAKTLVAEALTHAMGTSPDSRWFLFWQERKVQAYDLASGTFHDLTARAGGVDFENGEFDRPVEKPAYGVGGWSGDGRSVFLNHRFDVWQVPLDGGEAVNLTGGMGDRERIRFRIMDLDTEDDGVDTSRPIFLSAYGEWTKRSGYSRARPGRDPEQLLFQDAMLGTPGFRGAGIQKALESDRVLFTRQTFREFPDYWVSDTRFRSLRRVTDANPQQAEYLWGSRVLVDYTNQRGHDLQATLTLPAGYEPGRRYPMIVYFYEKMSQRHHEYSQPVYDDRPHMSFYASNGYLVLMPDIVYDMGYPGSSALDDVVSSARAAIAAGYADPDRICLQGHSWGGYQSSFILTQTDMFACVVTGAPLTNLVSMHNILYKQSGNPNASLIQWGQGRMDTTPFHDLERYVAESPVHNVASITTPFLILHGTADGAVDWNQGLEYYIAARRMGKEVILLSYPDEPHHLGRKENQIDFQIRMRQYFDHFLKGASAPRWMTDGVLFLEKGRVGPEDGGRG